MVFRPNFPLPKDYFGATRVSDEQETRYRGIVDARLASALRDEHDFVHSRQRVVNADKWRLVKKKHQLRIYRRRKYTLTSDEDKRKPSMLSVGRMTGCLEDVIYGAYDKSTEELKTTIAFVDLATKDCRVLHSIALATPDDPFHYIGIKWLSTELPVKFIVRPRDWCYLEAMGIQVDADGNRFGYILQHSVDIKNCPPFDHRAVVRGRLRLSFIFREPVPGVLEVFAQGLFDPAGELIQRFATIVTSEVISSIFKTVPCAEAKKLTLLALRNFKGGNGPDQKTQELCSMCRGTGKKLFSTSLKVCRVCGVTVCSQCRVKKSVFIGPAHSLSKVSCCRMCIAHATAMEIRPADPNFSILGEQYLPQDLFWLQTGEFNSVESIEEPTTIIDNNDKEDTEEEEEEDTYDDTDDLSDLDTDGYRFSADSGVSEGDVERMIATLMKKKRIERISVQHGDPDFGLQANAENSPSQECLRNQAEAVHNEDHVETDASHMPTSSETSGVGNLSPDQAAIFQKILALQIAAEEVSSTLQANDAMMKNFT
ncbi:hypothetical protein FI667_g16040, partial [Globisporangium splendens]